MSPRAQQAGRWSAPRLRAGGRARAEEVSKSSGWRREMRDEGASFITRSTSMSTDLVYGRRAVREALRGRPRCSSCSRRSAPPPRSPGSGEARPKLRRGDVTSSELRGHARPPGCRCAGRAVSLRGRLRAGRRRPGRPARCSTGSRTRTNLGAVCRSAEGAGATGVVVSRRTARRWSRPPSRAPLQARSSICRSRSSRTSPATSRT